MRRYQKLFTTSIAAISLLMAACGGPAATTGTPTGSAAGTVVSTPAASATATVSAAPTTATAKATTAPTPSTNATVAPTPSTSSATPTTASASDPTATAASSIGSVIRYDVVTDGSQAGFQVREQLARLSFPSDAIGTTNAVTGSIVLGADGKIVSDQSKFVVDLTSLHTDSAMRDRFIDRNTLDTASYPTATFVPTEIKGLPSPLPTSGKHTFQMIGNLTIHGVTRPVTWNVTSQVDGNDVTGQATTSFKFEDFGMRQPRAAAVLSVNDDVKLQVTLHLVKSA
jgi:polyisoprenoid-binding protein YceI